ncbi:MAG: hypothetical protein CMO74_12310 [Verrucomicrobiales bacterium]|nr:hypothetical protein [Verrucomicrobiales bacterium]|tara:strand:+ start:4651 stop:4863 length:213 start_codon:yes stop_codon:yes gene_type:complete
MKTRSKHRRGVTILELMLVVAIIGILMSMMLPVFAKALRKARNVGHENPNDPNGPRIAPSSVKPGQWDRD